MAWFVTRNIKMAGIASAVPQNCVTARSREDTFGEKAVEKFVESTGMASVHITLPQQVASDLGYAAGEKLLQQMDIDRSQIGVLVFVTLSPDYKKPATACILQKRLGLSVDCACMDVGHGCAGFVYGNQVIESMMMTSDCKYGLLILGETTSKVTDKQDVNSMMFGDAGAAVLYCRSENTTHTTLLRSDGERFKSLLVPAGGFRNPEPETTEYITSDGVKKSKYDIYMDGMDVFLFSINDVPAAIDEYLKKTGSCVADYDVVAFHQANSYILQRLMRKYKIDKNHVPLCLDRYGNTSSVSIPLVLCDHFGNSNEGVQNVLACGFGTGLAWGVTSFEIDTSHVYPIEETDEWFSEGRVFEERMD